MGRGKGYTTSYVAMSNRLQSTRLGLGPSDEPSHVHIPYTTERDLPLRPPRLARIEESSDAIILQDHTLGVQEHGSH